MRLLLIVLAAVVTTGCSRSAVSNYYLLTPRSPRGADAASGLYVGVGPVTLPKYVDRVNIVTNAEGQRLFLAEEHLWAEPLDRSFSRVLRENLSGLLKTDDVYAHPWSTVHPPEIQVSVEVIRLDGTLGGDAHLSARWTVLTEGGKKHAATRRTNLTRPAGDDHNAFAAAMSDLLAELSARIAEAIPAGG